MAKRGLGLTILLALAVAGCAPKASTHATLTVDAATALADRAVHITVRGLTPHDTITVRTTATDFAHHQWHAQASYTADGNGVVNLDQARPHAGGSYTGVDGMGLFWSMNGGAPGSFFGPEYPPEARSYPVELTVTAHGRQLATQTVTRRWLAPGVTGREVSLATDHVYGELFLPPAGAAKRPAVLWFGGSEGGLEDPYTAALLASHGYPCLAIAYFRESGLPATLDDVPLEYFATAARFLARQPGVDPARITAMGYSRGSEAALLIAQNFPDLFHGAIVYSPSAYVNLGFPDESRPAWTLGSHPLSAAVIPVDRISGPVLAIAGADDGLWPLAPIWAQQIAQHLDTAHSRYPHKALVYPDAGHLVGTFPYGAGALDSKHPVTGAPTHFGGTRAGDNAARVKGWAAVLRWLDDPAQVS